MKKKDLEIKISKLKPFEDPEPELEQYKTPSDITALITHLAYMQGNIKNKTVIDLGCGTGGFAIAAKLLGAKKAIGIDIDPDAIKIARENSSKLNINVEWITKDVENLDTKADTVIQNPPFGAQKKGKDRIFIEKALETAPVTYSLHNAVTEEFVENYVEDQGGKIAEKTTISFPIRRTFNFHKKKEKPVKVNLYKFIRDN